MSKAHCDLCGEEYESYEDTDDHGLCPMHRGLYMSGTIELSNPDVTILTTPVRAPEPEPVSPIFTETAQFTFYVPLTEQRTPQAVFGLLQSVLPGFIMDSTVNAEGQPIVRVQFSTPPSALDQVVAFTERLKGAFGLDCLMLQYQIIHMRCTCQPQPREHDDA